MTSDNSRQPKIDERLVSARKHLADNYQDDVLSLIFAVENILDYLCDVFPSTITEEEQ